MSRRPHLLLLAMLVFITTGVLVAQQDKVQTMPVVKDELRARYTQQEYENYLRREKQGEVLYQGGVVPTNRKGPSSLVGDILVNNNAGASGTSNFTQSETAIIAFGNTVLISFNDAGSFQTGGNHFTGYSRSTDGGATFVDGGILPSSAIGDAGDPVLARDEITGRIYLSTLGFATPNTIQMWRSDDNGGTWMAAVNATPGGSSEDKQWHTVDNFPGAGNGNVYVLSRRFGTGPGIYAFRSTDQGATFGPNGGTLIFSGGQGAFVAVGPDHSVYAFWFTGTTLQMRKSTDQGVTFASAVTVFSGLVGGGNGDLGLTGIRQGLSTASAFRSNEFPHVAINPVSGNIYVTYNNDGPGADKADVFLVQSTDGGTTWSAPLKINDDVSTTDQWQPTIAVSPSGSELGIFYYSRQEDPANNLFKYYGRLATISGSTMTFRPSFAVSDSASLPEFGRDAVVNAVYMGDYNMVHATSTAFHVVWSDNRSDLPNGSPRKDPNVYYKSIPTAENYGWAKGVAVSTAGGAILSNVEMDITNATPFVGAFSDVNGLFKVGARVDTPATTRSITIRGRKFGYIDTTHTVTITRGDTLNIGNFALRPAPGGTLSVFAHTATTNIRAYVEVRFGTQVVLAESTNATTGLLTAPLPVGTYSVTVDAPHPYATRRFPAVVITAGTTTNVDALLRAVVEYAPAEMRDTLLVGGTRDKILALTNTTPDSVRFRISDDNTTRAFSMRVIVPEPAVQEKPIERPKGTPDTEFGDSPDGRGGPDAFGYQWIDSDEPGGPAFSWVDISTIGTQITAVTSGTLDDGFATVPMHFPFPLYGNSYTSINIGTNGFVNFGTGSSATTNGAIPSTAAPNNAIYPFWDDLDFRTRGRLLYYRDSTNGRFIVQYHEVPRWSSGAETDTVTFQIIMKPNGEITMNYGRMGSPTLNSATIGVENAAGTVGLQVVNNAAYVHDNLAIRIYLPDASWLSESPTFGTIPPNSNLNITVGFNAAGLTPGTTYNGKIVLDATHPDLTSPFNVPASLRVQPADSALLVLNKTSISFGTIALGTNRRDTTLIARNVGSQLLTVSSITSNNPRFVVDRSSATIAAGDSVRIRVTYTPTFATTDTGRIIMLSNSQGSPRKDVTLSGSSVGVPRIVAVPDSFSIARPVGVDTTRATFRIRNGGTDTLRYTINEGLNSASDGSIERSTTQQPVMNLAKGQYDPTPGQHASPNGRGGPDAFGYSWIDSDEPGGPAFNWVDISTTGTQITTWTGSADDGYSTVPLPWAFPFYGVDQNSVNIATNGFMNFGTGSTTFTNTAIPTTGAPNNAIYPYWDDFNLTTSGQVFYQNDAANGRFIVQWHNVPHYALGTPPELDTLTFQVILRQSGDILYQYLRKATAESTATVGVENSSGTIALQTSFNRRYVKPNLAVLVTKDLLPWLSTDRTSGTIAPADSQAVELRIHPAGINGGVFNGRLVITGNSSDTARVKVRLNLTGGAASIVVTSPNGGESWRRGNTYPIVWTKNLVDSVRIEVSTAGSGGPWTLIAGSLPAKPSVINPKTREEMSAQELAGTYNWSIPPGFTLSNNCYIRVSDKANLTVSDISNAAFSILAAPSGDTSWVTQTSGVTSNLFSVKTISDSVGWTAGASGVVLRTTNAGTTWTSVGGSPIGTADIYNITAVDRNVAFVTTTPGATFIYRTTNGGTSWAQVFTQTGGFIDAIHMFDVTNGIAVGDPVGGKWTIAKTSDGGTTWARIATEPTQQGTEAGWINSFGTLGATHVWFGANGPRIYRSTDVGTTWSFSATNFTGPDSTFAIQFNSLSVGLAGSASAINKSTDAGASWASASGAPAAIITGMAGNSGSQEFWATTYTGATAGNVYYTSNAGTSWGTSSPNGYVSSAGMIHISMLNRGSNLYAWAVGAGGKIVRYKRFTTGVQSLSAQMPLVYALDQNFPNPFNPTTTIRFALPEQATVSLKIYNLLGQEVVTLAQGDLSAAFHSVVWNGRNNAGSQVASGMYFYRIDATGVSGSTFNNLKKLILLK